MKCPWCGSKNAECEYVDAGVGLAMCFDCNATEIDWRHFAGLGNSKDAEYYKEWVHDPPPSEEEKKKGWWKGHGKGGVVCIKSQADCVTCARSLGYFMRTRDD